MEIVDLSHGISPLTPVYPGTAAPEFIEASTLETHGFREKRIAFHTHTGTHVDAPAHILEAGRTLDQFPVRHFFGRAALLDCRDLPGDILQKTYLINHEPRIREIDFLILHTGWSQHWGTEDYFKGYPVLSPEAADWLGRFPFKGIGVDALSVDGMDSTEYPNHRILLKRNILIIENLTGLHQLPSGGFAFACFPLAIKDGDGSPLRAVGLVPSGQGDIACRRQVY